MATATRLEALAGRQLSLEEPFDIAQVRETRLSRLLMIYITTGLLFMLPGVLSDGFALMLLMLPINRGRYGPEPAVAGRTHVRRRTTIDGNFRRLD